MCSLLVLLAGQMCWCSTPPMTGRPCGGPFDTCWAGLALGVELAGLPVTGVADEGHHWGCSWKAPPPPAPDTCMLHLETAGWPQTGLPPVVISCRALPHPVPQAPSPGLKTAQHKRRPSSSSSPSSGDTWPRPGSCKWGHRHLSAVLLWSLGG